MASRKTKRHPVVSGTNTDDERILSTAELVKRIPLRRETIQRMAREGRFPQPIQLTTYRIGWRWSAILDWLNERETSPGRRRKFFEQRIPPP